MNLEKRSGNKSQVAGAGQAMGLGVDTAPYGAHEDEWVRVYGKLLGKEIDAFINVDTRFVRGTAEGEPFDSDDVFNSEVWFSAITDIANGHVPVGARGVLEGQAGLSKKGN